MKKIAIIPARSGSKGLPHKNILNLGGKPLLSWSIEAALESKVFDRVILSTDSKQYGRIGKQYGAEVIYRNEVLSNDKATTYDVLEDLFKKIDINDVDYFVLLQPTSPLRNSKHIAESIELYESNFKDYNTLVSVCESHKSSDLIRPIDETLSLRYFDKDFSNYRRQGYKEYEPNGAIFISKINTYLKTKHFFGGQGIAYIMDLSSSIDIDNRDDFELTVNIINRHNKYTETLTLVQNRINEKKDVFYNYSKKTKNGIVMVGHSLIDKWDINFLGNYQVYNLGINGITSDMYYSNICNDLNIKFTDNVAVVMLGTNDIIFTKNKSKILNDIISVINYLKQCGVKKLFYIKMTHVNGRIDRNNDFIDEVNSYILPEISKKCNVIDTGGLDDDYGWLNERYTNDGLYLNKEGYKVLQSIIEEEILKCIE